MGKFAKAEKQAASVIKALQKSGAIQSLGTARGYGNALTRVAEFVKAERLGSLRDITPEQAVAYLEQRGEEVGQKQLDMERQAMQAMMQHVTGKLEQGERLTPCSRSLRAFCRRCLAWARYSSEIKRLHLAEMASHQAIRVQPIVRCPWHRLNITNPPCLQKTIRVLSAESENVEQNKL